MKYRRMCWDKKLCDPQCPIPSMSKSTTSTATFEITFTIKTDEENDFAVEEAMTKALDAAIPCAGQDAEIQIEEHGSVVRVHDLYSISARRVS